MKLIGKILGLVVLVVVAILLLNLVNDYNAPENLDEAFVGASIPVPETPLQVRINDVSTNPEYPYPLGRYDQGEYRGSVTLITPLAFEATETQTIVPFAVNWGGSGEFIYLGLFDTSDTYPVYQDAHPVGDRVEVELFSREDLGHGVRVTVLYKTHGPNQALAEDPAVDVELIIDVVDGSFANPAEVVMHQETTTCYLGEIGEGEIIDVAQAQVVTDGETVSGIFNWLPAQTDSLRGTFDGQVRQERGVTIFETIYDYVGEGMDLKDEKYFKQENNTLSVAFAEMTTEPNEDGVYEYVNPENLDYSIPMEETPCEEIDFIN